MQLGAIFPQTEIGADPIAVKDFAQAAEALGYEHLLVFDHVLGADHTQRAEWNRPYNKDDMFHEPFVMFGYLAALTEKIEFCTGIIILPQRQTALVAKQTAEVDVLTNGRLRLGIGVGWNEVEFEALGENWENRGRRSAEQVEVMRMLWTQEVVNYEGRYHKITHAGINPLPDSGEPHPGSTLRIRIMTDQESNVTLIWAADLVRHSAFLRQEIAGIDFGVMTDLTGLSEDGIASAVQEFDRSAQVTAQFKRLVHGIPVGSFVVTGAAKGVSRRDRRVKWASQSYSEEELTRLIEVNPGGRRSTVTPLSVVYAPEHDAGAV
ncbi:Uncharacterized protein Mb0965c [Geodia barretti]|uniref:Uncharacterized protein Mb0965c n=1 Tax=Geodia barretti TaxID=519541 RepID=A0AA35W4S3_GEOBA|nr:Uncharacterized protein Mb0965c [Geodia barretti]